jgi:hypothetical protein
VKINGARVNPYSLLELPFKNGAMPGDVAVPVSESGSPQPALSGSSAQQSAPNTQH